MAYENEDAFEGLLPIKPFPRKGAAEEAHAVDTKGSQTMAGFSDRGLLSAITGAVTGAYHAVAGAFKRYEPQPLNSRIQDPMIIPSDGRNPAVLGMIIDGKRHDFRLPQTAEAAVANGSLPLSTLANTVLQKYDAGQAQARQNYDMEQASHRENSRYVPSMHM